MNEQIKALYHLETESSRLDFEQDPDYQLYYTQAQALWEGGEMPPRLLPSPGYQQFPGFRPWASYWTQPMWGQAFLTDYSFLVIRIAKNNPCGIIEEKEVPVL